MNRKRIGIIGTGAFGIAFAKLCYYNQMDVICYTKLQEECENILRERENKSVLPNIKIDDEIIVTTDLEKTIINSDIIILVLPVQYLRSTIEEISNFDINNKAFFIASKGIEQESGLLLSNVFNYYIKTSDLAVISGPGFAFDIATCNKFGWTIATTNEKMYYLAQEIFANDYCSLEWSKDLIGVQLCGSLKNIFAIISGLLNGFNVSDTTKALFFTKAIEELKNIIMMLGGHEETIMTLSGIGDMYLTCNSSKSRNFEFGYLLANNKEEALNYLNTHTVEGVHTLKSVHLLLEKQNINTTLIEVIYNVIFNDLDSKSVLESFK